MCSKGNICNLHQLASTQLPLLYSTHDHHTSSLPSIEQNLLGFRICSRLQQQRHVPTELLRLEVDVKISRRMCRLKVVVVGQSARISWSVDDDALHLGDHGGRSLVHVRGEVADVLKGRRRGLLEDIRNTKQSLDHVAKRTGGSSCIPRSFNITTTTTTTDAPWGR